MTLKTTYNDKKSNIICYLPAYVEMCSLRRTSVVNLFTDEVKGGLKVRVMTY